MRILFVSHYALPHLGGIEMAIDAVAEALSLRGHDVCHVASAAGGAGPGMGAGPGSYRVVRVPALNLLETGLGVPYPLFSPQLARVLGREVARADVVHAHGLLYLGSALAFAVARRRPDGGPRRVLTEHVGHVPYSNVLLDRTEALGIATLGRATVRMAETTVVLNDDVRAEVARLAPRHPIVEIRNGIDTGRYRPPRPGEREALRRELGWDARPRVLFVGRMTAKKGVEVALEAAVKANGAFELVVVGPGRLEARAPAHAQVLGALSPERVAALYRASDAFLLPSHGEGFPLTAQEAMASGLPVVLSDAPRYSGHLEGAGAGVTLVAPEPGAIAVALQRLLTVPGALGAASRAALGHARRAPSWERAADDHERLYAEVAARR